jgi:hypothetical protein
MLGSIITKKNLKYRKLNKNDRPLFAINYSSSLAQLGNNNNNKFINYVYHNVYECDDIGLFDINVSFGKRSIMMK